MGITCLARGCHQAGEYGHPRSLPRPERYRPRQLRRNEDKPGSPGRCPTIPRTTRPAAAEDASAAASSRRCSRTHSARRKSQNHSQNRSLAGRATSSAMCASRSAGTLAGGTAGDDRGAEVPRHPFDEPRGADRHLVGRGRANVPSLRGDCPLRAAADLRVDQGGHCASPQTQPPYQFS